MKNIALVTGAEGFIGSHLCRYMQAQDWNVIGTHLPHNFIPSAKLPKLRYVQLDLRNGQRMAEIFNTYEPTHIFHMGAQSLPTISWADPVTTFESNIMGSLHVYESARHMKRTPVIVSACSSAEYGNVPPAQVPVKESQPLQPLHPYGISKVCQDLLGRQYFLDYGVHSVNLRLFNTTGPGKTSDAPSDFVRQLVRIRKGKQKPYIEVGNLKPLRAFLDVNDTVNAFYLAALKGKPGESYNVCATATREIGDLLNTAIRLAKVEVEVRQASHLMRPSDEKIIFGSTEKLRKDTGWKPKYTLEQTLQSMIDYWNAAL